MTKLHDSDCEGSDRLCCCMYRAEAERLRVLLRDVLYWYWNANSTGMPVDLLDRIALAAREGK